MSAPFNFVGEAKTPEEREVADAIERHKDARWWEKNLQIAAWVFYAVAVGLWIFTDQTVGAAWLIVLALFAASAVAGYIEAKRRFKVVRLVNVLKRKNAVPFYHEMLERFRDEPMIHIHLNDDGSITINDKRKQETNHATQENREDRVQ